MVRYKNVSTIAVSVGVCFIFLVFCFVLFRPLFKWKCGGGKCITKNPILQVGCDIGVVESLSNVGSGGGNDGLEDNTTNWSTTVHKDTKKPRILLLGDSIIDNRPYVPNGKSVYDLLKMTMDKEYNIFLFARDGYTVTDVFFQISKLPIKYNTTDTTIVLSVGGNDFLSGSSYANVTVEYTHLIERIREKYGSCKLYLVNLYSPVDPLFAIYNRIIAKWNGFLKEFVEKGMADGIVDIYDVINSKEDLTHKIEPSAIGGEKISLAIMNAVGG